MAAPPTQGFDTSSLSEKDLRVFRLYGRLPSNLASKPPSTPAPSSTSTTPYTTPTNSGSSLQPATITSTGPNATTNAVTTRFARHLRERKYFDSGDYALCKAGRGNSVDVGMTGSAHPAPEEIPHPVPLSIMQRRRGSSFCGGVSGTFHLGTREGEGEDDGGGLADSPGLGGWGRYRRSSLSVEVVDADGGYEVGGVDGRK
ncbi:hypothetical protein NEUTE1DRAFT_73843 [Neurospora tetrasperma FGSC 2508]|uniref:mRNA stability protein n=1 Tax=Neurospora tetrasperma (strain FGSC 2508 / ATCC MYA-4615 / P0657) TaxID=510951 RepID=F8N2T2_NEUT8|nr:uncharacterized protein NEUTE1DRAFT_73843 [Neurospora tetrasperma FGSC 2508]EGO53346.1 hypothetical protein NEUTE1DRAFT_73843 [Neurospora tetrasperma FGSC 2508]